MKIISANIYKEDKPKTCAECDMWCNWDEDYMCDLFQQIIGKTLHCKPEFCKLIIISHNEELNPDVSKRFQLKNELSELHDKLNSRYNAYGHIEPSLVQQKIIRDRINEINVQLKNK